jgi:hypothetical protein
MPVLAGLHRIVLASSIISCTRAAISQATGNEGNDGAVGYNGHPADGLSEKYGKPAHTKLCAHIGELIYGLGSIKDGQPVSFTNGITNAIVTRQVGYACISPVLISGMRADSSPINGERTRWVIATGVRTTLSSSMSSNRR